MKMNETETVARYGAKKTPVTSGARTLSVNSSTAIHLIAKRILMIRRHNFLFPDLIHRLNFERSTAFRGKYFFIKFETKNKKQDVSES
jgi:hypothetical protein